jgi:HlyD family secretion protein
MRIVPENDRLIARVRVSPVDIGKTSLGQTAVLRFSAFNQDQTPQFDGRVIAVSVVAVIDDGDRRRLLRSDGRNPG